MTVFVAIGASGAKGAAGGAALVLATGENSLSSESSMPMQARSYSENLKYVGTIEELEAEIMRRMRLVVA
jgi:hypothetical protein